MGLTNGDCKFLFYAKSIGVSYEEVLTLGRLTRYYSYETIKLLNEKYNANRDISKTRLQEDYSDYVFDILGSKTYSTMDHSNYEGANIIHDLNSPISCEYHGRYSCVLDSGTIEHVFNFPQAISNCMKALKIGGHFIGISPVNNLMGHGFYQFSPELFYRVFTKENGFKVNMMIIAPLNSEENWYKVADPALVSSRVTVSNKVPLTLMVIAEKISDCEPFLKWPMQSDYSNAWSHYENEKLPSSSIKRLIKKLLPSYLLKLISAALSHLRSKEIVDPHLGKINPDHFEKINI